MPPPTNRPAKSHRTRSSLLVLLFAFFLGAGALYFSRSIQDYMALHGYQAPSTIVSIALQDTMTPDARRVLYVNHPDLESKTTFASKCPNNGGEQTIVLGCYHSDQNGIFLLNVSDSRLNGVEQVTAAHEMLHAEYDRLSSSARSKVDAMLLDYYNHDLTDPRIKDTIAAYKKTEPNDVVNEMHSVFGTEVTHLPNDLEAYYKKYFTNRKAVAGFAAQYQDEFTSRQAAVAQDDDQLNGMKLQINEQEADLKTKLTAITSDQQTLQSERSSKQIAAYNSGVPNYNAMINAYNAEINSLQSLITQYNTLVSQRNAIALEEQQLQSDLSSNTATISN